MNSRGGTLIVDSGSTKATWAMWDAEGSYMGQYRTTGFNPYYQDEEEIARTIALELMPALGETPIAHVAFAAGKPCLVIRTMSDCADDDTDVTYDDFLERAADQSARIVLAMLEEARP